MNRSSSRMVGGQLVEYAAYAPGGMSDAETAERGRNAPAWAKRSMDASRQARGLPPLWPESGAAPSSKSVKRSAPPAKKRPEPKAWNITGAATPGTSMPIVAGTDGLLLPERFEPNAFRRSVAEIAAKQHRVGLRMEHDGLVFASTDDGTLKVWIDQGLGLMVRAAIPNTREWRSFVSAVASGRVGFSVGFAAQRVSIRREGGRQVRVVEAATLQHIAAIRMGDGRGCPAYQSRATVTPFEYDERVADLKGKLRALKIVCEQEGLIR